MDEITNSQPIVNDTWMALREFTAARIALGRTGNSIPLQELFDFKLAHAHARDAVFSELDIPGITNSLNQFDNLVFTLHSKATNRAKYLKRPDYGRKLNEASTQYLESIISPQTDITIVIADGLSATAVNQYAVSMLECLMPKLLNASLKLSPFVIVKQGRVAVADEIGYLLRSKLSIILIGERPGLSAPDSMGAYLTFNPQPGLTDESRNCVSNIRPDGLNMQLAADKLFYLICQSLQRKLSGIDLKDNSGLIGE